MPRERSRLDDSGVMASFTQTLFDPETGYRPHRPLVGWASAIVAGTALGFFFGGGWLWLVAATLGLAANGSPSRIVPIVGVSFVGCMAGGARPRLECRGTRATDGLSGTGGDVPAQGHRVQRPPSDLAETRWPLLPIPRGRGVVARRHESPRGEPSCALVRSLWDIPRTGTDLAGPSQTSSTGLV